MDKKTNKNKNKNKDKIKLKEQYSVWAKNVFASYDGKKIILKDINLSLKKGELISILGPNGAGKSTLFYLLTGIKKPQKGELLIFGKTVKKQCKNNNIAYVPQAEQIDWDYPVRVWDLVLGGRYSHMLSVKSLKSFLPPRWAGKEHKTAVEKALKAVDMLEYKKSPIRILSGGQKKRIFLARALAQNSQLLLLDEPLVGVDQKSTDLIMDVLIKLKNEGKTIIMISHDLNKVKKYAQKIMLLKQKIIALGSTEEVLKSKELSSIYNINLEQNDMKKESNLKNIFVKKQTDEVLSYVE